MKCTQIGVKKKTSVRKKPILLKSITGRRENTGKVVIGILGTHPGAGVTYVGILLGRSLRERRNREIAFVELGEERDVRYIKSDDPINQYQQKQEQASKIKGITFFDKVNDSDLISILNKAYDYVIIDFGSNLNKNKNEFLRCNIKLIVGSLTKWKQNKLESFIGKNKETEGFSEWIYLIVFGQRAVIAEVKHKYHIPVYQVDYEADPFLPSDDIAKLCDKIIYGC